MGKGFWRATALAAFVAALVLPGTALADRPAQHAFSTQRDTYSVDPVVRDGQLPVDTTAAPSGVPSFRSLFKTQAAAADPAIGTQKMWVILDDKFGTYRLAAFTLRAAAGARRVRGCRTTSTSRPAIAVTPSADRIQVTDAQVNYLLDQFDNNIWPKEAEAFSVAPPRDGTNATAAGPRRAWARLLRAWRRRQDRRS